MKDQYYVQQYVLSKMRQGDYRLWSGITIFCRVPHPAAQRTRVEDGAPGSLLRVGKVFSVFMSMDKMIGGDFERDLASMKSAAER
ncbi:hypothetical protein [Granulicella sp. S156]|jgi:hypothetical protein|uniref:hypothetical protein n=1 Tax=Granulicella sp. S156 TaxID=1747224 RepID=UPI00131BEBDE|nr:hypothetical protein [Granulicella sp. S156]